MLSLHIKRHRFAGDPKQALRAQIETLPIDQQRAFVTLARQLIRERTRKTRPTRQ